MPKPSGEPRRVESPARMTVASEPPVEQVARMQTVPADDRLPAVNYAVTSLALSDNLAPPDPWLPMSEALTDGTMIEAKDAAGTPHLVIRRKTSRHNGIRWVPHEFWSSPMNRVPIEVEFVGWRPAPGRVAPGAVVA